MLIKLVDKSNIFILRSLALRLLDCLGEENLDPVLCEAVRLEGAREVIHKPLIYFINLFNHQFYVNNKHW